jgi:DNA invertase Pin-like site-specific DNA recombinase
MNAEYTSRRSKPLSSKKEETMNPKSANNPNVRCAIYARSATGNTEAIENQVLVCRKYIANKPNWTVADGRVYIDGPASGNAAGRPGLQALLDAALAKPPSIDNVVVADTSRLARNLGFLAGILTTFALAGIVFYCAASAEPRMDEDVSFLREAASSLSHSANATKLDTAPLM